RGSGNPGRGRPLHGLAALAVPVLADAGLPCRGAFHRAADRSGRARRCALADAGAGRESTGARHLYAAGGLYRFPADPCLAGRGERAALSWGHASAGIVRRRACPGPERGPIRHLSKVGAVNGNLPPPLVCGGGAFESLDDRRVTAAPRYERALALLAGPAAASGDFMQIAAQALSVGLGCRCAGVVVRSDDGRTARTLSWWLDGEWQP